MTLQIINSDDEYSTTIINDTMKSCNIKPDINNKMFQEDNDMSSIINVMKS